MNVKFKKAIAISYIFSFFFSILITTIQNLDIKWNNNNLFSEEIDEKSQKFSGFWNFIGNPIFIDGTTTGVDAHNWTWAESQEWCSGSGTWNSPYVLENIRIDANNSGSGIEVRNSNVYFEIKNCTIFNSSYYNDGVWHAGIKLFNVNNSKIIGNNCSFNYRNGISLENCFNNSISNNQVISNSRDGLYMIDSHFTQIYNNTFSNNTHSGIALWSSHNNSIIENTLKFNEYSAMNLYVGQDNNISKNSMEHCGIRIFGNTIQYLSLFNIDSLNELNGKPIYYFVHETKLDHLNFTNAGQIILVNCSDSIITGLNLTYGSVGLSLYYCDNITAHHNTFSYNSIDGIFTEKSSNNSFSWNVCEKNQEYGIRISYGKYNKIFNNEYYESMAGININLNEYSNITGNTFVNNSIGIQISQCKDSLFFNNTLYDNREGIYFSSSENSTLSNNICYNNERGIRSENGNNNDIVENTLINNNESGIALWNDINYTLLGNNFTKCGLTLTGTLEKLSSHNISTSNIVNERLLYYYIEEKELVKQNFTMAGQIILVNCNDTIISDQNISYTTTGISLFYCKNITVFNCTHNYNYKFGIDVEYSAETELLNNTLNANLWAAKIYDSSNNSIIGNEIHNNVEYGLNFYYAADNKVFNNSVFNTQTGIATYESNRSEIIDNRFENNSFFGIFLIYNHYVNLTENLMINSGISIDGIYSQLITYNIDTTNKVNGKPVYYYIDRIYLNHSHFVNPGQIFLINCSKSSISNISISFTSISIMLFYCKNISISDCNFFNCTAGLLLRFCENNTLSGNFIINNYYLGILVQSCVNNSIYQNNFTNNYGDYGSLTLMFDSNNNSINENTINDNNIGILIEVSSYNTIKNNYIKNNDKFGIYLESWEEEFSISNEIYNNTFINNLIENAYDNGINTQWDNGSIGNYWDDYSGEDLNYDGIGDTPYYISGPAGSKDRFPIMLISLPQIIIQNPAPNELFGHDPPEVTLSIISFTLDSLWYMLYNDTFTSNNHTLTTIVNNTFTGSIEQTYWDLLGNGTVIIKFFANDSHGYTISTEITIKKDIIAPRISILNPYEDEIFKGIAPTYNITIDEPHLASIWYTINDGVNNITLSDLIGTINQDGWNNASEGKVTIKFYARDTVGNIGYEEITVVKALPSKRIPSYVLIIIIFSISLVSVIIIRKRKIVQKL